MNWIWTKKLVQLVARLGWPASKQTSKAIFQSINFSWWDWWVRRTWPVWRLHTWWRWLLPSIYYSHAAEPVSAKTCQPKYLYKIETAQLFNILDTARSILYHSGSIYDVQLFITRTLDIPWILLIRWKRGKKQKVKNLEPSHIWYAHSKRNKEGNLRLTTLWQYNSAVPKHQISIPNKMQEILLLSTPSQLKWAPLQSLVYP